MNVMIKMVRKKEANEVEMYEEVGILKWIGPYLSERLEEFNIVTCEDLLEEFLLLCEEWDGLEEERKGYVKEWLEEAMDNEKSGQCVDPKGQDRGVEHYGYKVRKANKMGFNSIVKFWKYHAPTWYRKYVPTLKKGRTSMFQTYPVSCIT